MNLKQLVNFLFPFEKILKAALNQCFEALRKFKLNIKIIKNLCVNYDSKMLF